MNMINKKGEGQIDWTVSLVLFALFSLAIISFVISFADDNDVDISTETMISGLNASTTTDLNSFNTKAEKTTSAIMNSSINTQSGTVESVGSFAITPFNLISVVTNNLRFAYYRIFGTSSGFGIFLTTFLGLVVFITGMYIWKTVAGRTPD